VWNGLWRRNVTIFWAEAWTPRLATLKHGQLMPQRNALPNQIAAGRKICPIGLNGIKIPFCELHPQPTKIAKLPVAN
jgi:hypothetical protein